jgi:hypothetical protein
VVSTLGWFTSLEISTSPCRGRILDLEANCEVRVRTKHMGVIIALPEILRCRSSGTADI